MGTLGLRAASAGDVRRDGAAAAVALPDTRQFDLTERGQLYRIQVAVPNVPAPPEGFPVVVMVDGNALFASAYATARLLSGRPQISGVGPAILVGIGYPGDAVFDHERRRGDLLPENGGADRFLSFLDETVLPAVAGHARLDRSHATLVGHSFGGLFALHALFSRPGLFSAYVAGSPSIWWNDRAILGAEDRFAPPSSVDRPRLLVVVGAEEQSAETERDPARAERLRQARMVDNAHELAQRLTARGDVHCRYRALPGENHISVVPTMLARALVFAHTGSCP